MSDNISKFHGAVRPCSCGAYDKETGKVNPEKSGDRACRFCFGRGFVAACLGCEGKGRNEVPVNGNDKKLGVMASTCSPCGGMGIYGVNKPKDWSDEPVAEAVGA